MLYITPGRFTSLLYVSIMNGHVCMQYPLLSANLTVKQYRTGGSNTTFLLKRIMHYKSSCYIKICMYGLTIEYTCFVF